METQQYLMLTRSKRSTNARHKIRRNKAQSIQRLPFCLRKGMEKLSGVDLTNVRVHYNSSKPAQVQAHAYAQGEDIYLAPGQEHHLPHELGHVVQQALDMVKPTAVLNGVAINDDPRLEEHATELGHVAEQVGGCKNEKTIQAMSDHLATESSMDTYLTATLGDHLLCENLKNSSAGHSEDRFIDEVLPASVGFLNPNADNVIFLGINRSPCTSTDYCQNGQPSSSKGGGALGCSERLIHLVNHGFSYGGQVYPIRLVISFRNLYGSNAEKQANSMQALTAMADTGRITLDTQQLGGPSSRFSGTAATKAVSEL
ncbi:DUF4157 domain-containing protein [Marinomonas mediterranea]|uniref:eCIS core domain-containing protein n=1 Tax=Marinomonas mediterranea TaxID=119864 RepID=UPI00234B7720|nr:DUF4157 domain-containing protein [Marinomonas mediterranea]WCN13978.1 DUF4157 domain-containing protein [Marinomonas mediterranea]